MKHEFLGYRSHKCYFSLDQMGRDFGALGLTSICAFTYHNVGYTITVVAFSFSRIAFLFFSFSFSFSDFGVTFPRIPTASPLITIF